VEGAAVIALLDVTTLAGVMTLLAYVQKYNDDTFGEGWPDHCTMTRSRHEMLAPLFGCQARQCAAGTVEGAGMRVEIWHERQAMVLAGRTTMWMRLSSLG
jgi:hypothetical protein